MSANKKLLDRYVERYNAGDLDALTVDTLYYDNVSVLAQLGLVPEGVPA